MPSSQLRATSPLALYAYLRSRLYRKSTDYPDRLLAPSLPSAQPAARPLTLPASARSNHSCPAFSPASRLRAAPLISKPPSSTLSLSAAPLASASACPQPLPPRLRPLMPQPPWLFPLPWPRLPPAMRLWPLLLSLRSAMGKLCNNDEQEGDANYLQPTSSSYFCPCSCYIHWCCRPSPEELGRWSRCRRSRCRCSFVSAEYHTTRSARVGVQLDHSLVTIWKLLPKHQPWIQEMM